LSSKDIESVEVKIDKEIEMQREGREIRMVAAVAAVAVVFATATVAAVLHPPPAAE
jgi:hypothetical protein